MTRIGAVAAVGRGRVLERDAREKSAKRRRSTTVRPARPAVRMRRVTRSTSATATASSAPGERLREPSALWAPTTAPAARAHPPGIAVVRHRVQPPSRGASQDRDERASGRIATWPTVMMPSAPSRARRGRPDAPQPLDRQGMQERRLLARGDDEQAVRLGDAAGDLREMLGRRDADADRQADLLADRAAQRRAITAGVTADVLQPADVEERLVDRQRLDQRGVRSKIAHTARLAST